MATSQPHEPKRSDYRNCIIRPLMTDEDGTPLIEKRHVLDAGIVAAIAFFSLLGGDVLLGAVIVGEGTVTLADVQARLITAGLAFGLTFFAQWARYRGIEIRRAWNRSGGD